MRMLAAIGVLVFLAGCASQRLFSAEFVEGSRTRALLDSLGAMCEGDGGSVWYIPGGQAEREKGPIKIEQIRWERSGPPFDVIFLTMPDYVEEVEVLFLLRVQGGYVHTYVAGWREGAWTIAEVFPELVTERSLPLITEPRAVDSR